MKTSIVCVFFLLGACSVSNPAGESVATQILSPQSAADHVVSDLKTAEAVNFFFLTRTEDYSLSPDLLRKESTLRIYRACGGNCARFMNDVVDHLLESKPAKCLPGQEDALIEFGKSSPLVFSYSGRQISYKGNCYMNENGIRAVVMKPSFFAN